MDNMDVSLVQGGEEEELAAAPSLEVSNFSAEAEHAMAEEEQTEETGQEPSEEVENEGEGEEEVLPGDDGNIAFDGAKSTALGVPGEEGDTSSLSIGLSVASVEMDLRLAATAVEEEEAAATTVAVDSDLEERERPTAGLVESTESQHAEDSGRAEDNEEVRENASKSAPKAEGAERGESEPGVPRPNVIWRADNSTDHCAQCYRFFTLFHRRHHCRTCGWLFCDACSSRRAQLPPAFLQNHSVCSCLAL